jgi:hypothetical protein
VIATTTVADLHNQTGHAVTAGGTLLPMRDLIRMAAHATHYLAVFDHHTECASTSGGPNASRLPISGSSCTPRTVAAPHPAAPPPATSARSTTSKNGTGGATDIDKLTFACTGHHKLLDHGWTTKNSPTATPNGSHHPNSLPMGTNTYHHPEKLLS